MQIGTVGCRAFDHHRQQCRLRDRQVAARAAEPGQRCGFDAPQVASQRDDVEIRGEQLFLAVPLFERARLGELAQLGAHVAFGRPADADDLAGDRRSARAPFFEKDVAQRGAREAEPVDAAVRPEAPVFDLDDGERHPAPHLRKKDGETELPVLRQSHAEQRAFPVADGR